MKTAKVLLALSISACAAAVAAACSSSSTEPGSGPVGSGSSGGVPSGGSRGGSSRGGAAITFACGPTLTCNSPITYCCVNAGGGSAGGDAATGGLDGSSATDGSGEAAGDSAEAGGSSDSSTSGDSIVVDDSAIDSAIDGAIDGATDGATDAMAPTDARSGAADAGGGTTTSGDGGLQYHCASEPSACMNSSIVLGCGSIHSCPSGQSCCGTHLDGGGFQSACASPPCLSGIALCVNPGDCVPGQTCVFPPSGMNAYGTCVMADAGAGEGGRDAGGGG